jgi:hypothetical protein
MATFEDYAERYQSVRMEGRDGILQITFHTGTGEAFSGPRATPEARLRRTAAAS